MENESKQSKSLIIPFISIAVFVSAFIFFYWLIGEDKTELPSELIGRPVPQFSVGDVYDSSIIHTHKEFEGKIVLVNVWASWCPSCYTEHPFWKEHIKNKDITLVGLNYRDKKENALKFLKQQGDYYQWNLFDEKGRLGIDFGVYGAPETYLIDNKGKVRYRHVGIVSTKVFNEIIVPIVEQIKKES
ncbi:MAG: DsbE family thiol:disulfide interchange protein [Kangiellaceae bacterium]